MIQTPMTPLSQSRRSINGLGIAGFVCALIGMVGLCLPGPGLVLSLIGLVLSAIALRQRPRGFAIAGLVLSILAFVLAIVAFVFLAASGGLGALMRRGAEHANGQMLVTAAQQYALDFRTRSFVVSDLSPSYLQGVATDSQGRPLVLRENNRKWEAWAVGADGLPDTSDDVLIAQEGSDLSSAPPVTPGNQAKPAPENDPAGSTTEPGER